MIHLQLATPSVPYFTTGRHRAFGAAALAILCAAGFAGICRFNITHHGFEHVRVIHSMGLDAAIPFTSGWVWVYLFYYPFCFLPLLLPEVRNDRRIFTRTILAFGLQFGVSFVFFLVWPLRMTHAILPLGLNGTILKRLYACDLGFNSFPSLHVANILFVSLLFVRLRGARFSGAVMAGAALIAASTMLIKQHFISDVLAGALLGCLSFVLAFSVRRPIGHRA